MVMIFTRPTNMTQNQTYPAQVSPSHYGYLTSGGQPWTLCIQREQQAPRLTPGTLRAGRDLIPSDPEEGFIG